MKEIPLTQGKVALIDDDDYERINRFKWFASGPMGVNAYYYASRMSGRRLVKMHQFIMGTDESEELVLVDHRDGDTLNNRKSNLRIATRSQNNANARKRSGTTSIYKGVSQDPRSSKHWYAHIRVNYEGINLGRFDDEIEAAKAYDKAALEAFGEFAKTNFDYA